MNVEEQRKTVTDLLERIERERARNPYNRSFEEMKLLCQYNEIQKDGLFESLSEASDKLIAQSKKIEELSKEKEDLLDFIERLSRNGAIDWTFTNFTKEAREILEKAGR